MESYPCAVCGSPVEMFPSQRAKRKYVFCSRQCLDTPFIEKVCEVCGKEFRACAKGADGAKFCSNECHNARNRNEQIHKKLPTVTLACKTCGKPFEVRRTYADKQLYCSRQCFFATSPHKAGPSNPRWKEKITLVCEHCGKTFETYPCRADQKYCCTGHAKIANAQRFGTGHKTNIEIAMAAALLRAKLLFAEQVPMMDRWLVDFLLTEYPIVVQCDGRYWHDRADTKHRDRGQDRYLANAGYIVLRFSDDQILKHIDGCISTIKRTIANHQLPLISY